MSETILRIALSELKTIRIKINGIVHEMPLDTAAVHQFLAPLTAHQTISKDTASQITDVVYHMARGAMSQDVQIEFVLPASKNTATQS